MTLDSETKKAIQDAFRAGNLRTRSVDTSTGIVGTYVVADVVQHYTPHKALHDVKTDCGTSVSVTGDHSLFGLINGRVTPVKVESLVVGDTIVQVDDGAVVKEVRVESVVQRDPAQHTYDLSVPGPENFVLSNGLLAHNTYSIGGVSLDLEKSSKYEGAYQAASDQFDKQLEKGKATINVVKGLQQPRFGMGIRSAFGPYVGAGVLSPRKFVGFVFPFLLLLQDYLTHSLASI